MGKLSQFNSNQRDHIDEEPDHFTVTDLDRLLSKKGQLGKREQKRLEKEKEAMRLKYIEKLKPREIARKLGMQAVEITKVDQRLKHNLAKSKQAAAMENTKKPRISQQNDPVIKDLVQQYLQQDGIYNLRCVDVQKFIQESDPRPNPVDSKVITHILRNDFSLRYKSFDGALVRYKDPEFEEKRLWVSRILAQFVGDGAIIISIDESNFRADTSKSFRWQFVERDHEFKKIILNAAQPERIHENAESSVPVYGDISSELSYMSRSKRLNVGSITSRGRGRGRRSESEESKGNSNPVRPLFTSIPATRGRGRPRLADSHSSHSAEQSAVQSPIRVMNLQSTPPISIRSQSASQVQTLAKPLYNETPAVPVKRGRGRPPKALNQVESTVELSRYQRSVFRQRSNTPSSVSDELVIQPNNVEEEKKHESSPPQIERTPNQEQPSQIQGASTLRKNFTHLNLRSPFSRHRSASQQQHTPHNANHNLGLTPVIEELTQLHLTSTVKKPRDDFNVTPHETPVLLLEIPQWDKDESSALRIPEQPVQIPQHAKLSRLEMIRQSYEQLLGKRSLLARQLASRKSIRKQQLYSFSLISAISQDEVIANQIVEGGIDCTIFENFIHTLLTHVRESAKYRGRRIVILMDNATIHHHQHVIDSILAMKVILLYNPQYSPFMNPIEQMFKNLKQSLKSKDISTKEAFVASLVLAIKEISSSRVQGMWRHTCREWLRIIMNGTTA